MKSRYFTHVHGFNDATRYVEILPNGKARLIFADRRSDANLYTLDACLEYVRRGVWKEVDALGDDTIYCSGPLQLEETATSQL